MPPRRARTPARERLAFDTWLNCASCAPNRLYCSAQYCTPYLYMWCTVPCPQNRLYCSALYCTPCHHMWCIQVVLLAPAPNRLYCSPQYPAGSTSCAAHRIPKEAEARHLPAHHPTHDWPAVGAHPQGHLATQGVTHARRRAERRLGKVNDLRAQPGRA